MRPRLKAFDYLGLVTGRDLLVELVGKAAGTKTNLTVLDVGCGSAPWKPLFEGKTSRYDGLDVKEGAEVTIVASAENMPIEDNTYDIVFSMSAIEHIPDAAAAIRECWRVLKPGGTAIIGVPFCWEIHGEPHDYRRWTPWGLKKDLEMFGEVNVFQTGNGITHLLLLQNVFLHRLQLMLLPVRLLFTPAIVMNNLLGAVAHRLGRRFTAYATFYVAVAEK